MITISIENEIEALHAINGIARTGLANLNARVHYYNEHAPLLAKFHRFAFEQNAQVAMCDLLANENPVLSVFVERDELRAFDSAIKQFFANEVQGSFKESQKGIYNYQGLLHMSAKPLSLAILVNVH